MCKTLKFSLLVMLKYCIKAKVVHLPFCVRWSDTTEDDVGCGGVAGTTI